MRHEIRDAGGEVVRASLIGADVHEFLWTVAAQFGLNPALSATPFALWRRLADRLIESRYQRAEMLILLDDADEGETAVFELILRLVQLDPHPDSRLTIVLATSDQGPGRLHPRLVELAELAIRLEPWSADETRGYLDFALRDSVRETPIFTPQGALRVHELAGGIPLAIKQLADLSLLAGAGLDQPQVDADTVDGAFQELGIVVGGPLRNSASR